MRPSLVALVVLGVGITILWLRLRRDAFWVLVLASLVMLVVGEALCRALDLGAVERVEWSESRADGELGGLLYEPGSVLVYTYPDNPRGYFDEANQVVGAINSRGFRGPERDPDKPPGTERIAVIGDSFTLGIGVRDEDTLPACLEAILTSAGADVEVLNFGLSGANAHDYAGLLENRALGYEPDVVILVLFLNDAGQASTTSLLNSPRCFGRLRRLSRLANAVGEIVERPAVHRELVERYTCAYSDSSEGWLVMQEALESASLTCSERGCRLLVALYPVLYRLDERYPFESVHDRIRAFCESRDLEFIDLRGAFDGCRGPELWVHRLDQHPNEVAHKRAGELLGAALLGNAFEDTRRMAPPPN